MSKEYQVSTGKALWLLDKVHFKTKNVQNIINDYSDILYPNLIEEEINKNQCILCFDNVNLYS